MERITCLILLISAMSPVSLCVSTHHFVLVQSPKTWYQAQSYCREKCHDLATIDDMREMETVLKTVEGKYGDAVWIGFSKGMTPTWHWSLPDKDFYKEGERDYLIWGQENDNNCAEYLDGKLYGLSCHINRYVLCFDGNTPDGNEYVHVLTGLNWTNAREHCRMHYTDLASVRNEVENQKVAAVAAGTRSWVGVFRDPWQWSDQTYSSFRYWKADKVVLTVAGEESCVAMLKKESGRWDERPCTERHPFLCYCPIMRRLTLRFNSLHPVLKENDPAAQDSVLKALEQQLKEMGLTNVTLHWGKHPDGRVFIKEPGSRQKDKETYCDS